MSKKWKNSIVGSGTEKPGDLVPHDMNFRRHPDAQGDTVGGSLDELGWIDEVLVNLRTGEEWPAEQRNVKTIINGHLRWELAVKNKEPEIPVRYVDLPPKKERLALAVFDESTAMAERDAKVLSELLSGLDVESEALAGWLDGMKEELKQEDEFLGIDAEEESDGSLLELLSVTIDEPRHEVTVGEVWSLGPHKLYCTGVFTGWPVWKEALVEGVMFVPYPGPLTALTILAEDTPLVMVQPDTYIAGHVLDRYADVKGEDAVGRIS